MYWILVNLLFFASIGKGQCKEIRATFTSNSPRIDGIIESLWLAADSAFGFVQYSPLEGSTATEKTTVYLLYDSENLYIAFKCFDSNPSKVDVRLVPKDCFFGSGDNIWVLLDTFSDKTTAYEFGVNAAGSKTDDRLYKDGRIWDPTFEGIWYSASKVADYGYNVEMAIPIKTLRYKEGIADWRINFFRFISRKNETNSWFPQKQSEGTRISRSGLLRGIQLKSRGAHLEIYPVAIARYDLISTHVQGGLDISWSSTSALLAFTLNPDFAQIEADPYTINLSKYEIFLDERRPFFAQVDEIFDTPIKLFYSRRIGKRLITGEDVPVIGGLKYVAKFGRLNFGFLSAITDEIENESKTLFSTGRLKLEVLENSDFGILYNEARDEKNSQKAFGFDGTFRMEELQLTSQIALSDSGHAEVARGEWKRRRFVVTAEYENYDEKFCIERVGFAPWKSRREYTLSFGPKFYNVGSFNTLLVILGAEALREMGYPRWGYLARLQSIANFTNRWEISSKIRGGEIYELNKWHNYYEISLTCESDVSKPISFYENILFAPYGYNYLREYFASMAINNFCIDWSINQALILSLNSSCTFEWKPDGDIEKISWILRPIMQYALTKNIHLRIYAEPNTNTNNHFFSSLLSWNIKPKTWLYLGYNETRDNTENNWVLQDRIIVAKIRYLVCQ